MVGEVDPSRRIIRPAAPGDVDSLARIYNFFVRETIVTFEEEPVSSAEMSRRVAEVNDASLPWLVAEQDGEVAGYAYATKWKARHGYRFSTEVTVYVREAGAGRGTGSALYGQLLPALQARGIHAVIGGIALPNPASVALHEKFGFEKVAHFKETGFKLGRWIDVGYWEKLL